MEHTSTTNIYASELFVLFSGYEKAFGRYTVRRSNDKGKMEGKALTIHEPITVEDWLTHVKGTGPGVGIIPLRADNSIVWGAIDIDVIGIDHKMLEKRCTDFSLPLVICASKSGGAHCYLFLDQPTPASKIVSILEKWAAALGHGGCEIFPKQTSRYDGKDVGNWLNMPYFGGGRRCIHDGRELTLPAFLDYAKSMRQTAKQLGTIAVTPSADAEGLFADGPPCLQFLAANGGFPDNTRNEGLYNVAVYLKKKDGIDGIDGVKSRLNEYNAKMCHPSLTTSEMATIEKSVGRKDYEYRCRNAPIAAHCMRGACLKREFGVGGGGPAVQNATRYMGDEVIWYFDVDDKRLCLANGDMTVQKKFQDAIFGATGRMPHQMAPNNWRIFLDDLGQRSSVIEVPEEFTDFGVFRLMLESYLLGQARTTSRDQLAESDSPFITGEGDVWFKSTGLRKHLITHSFKCSNSDLYRWLRQLGAEPEEIKIKGKDYRIWKMAAPQGVKIDEELPEFGTEEF
jgi:hypothetical protein